MGDWVKRFQRRRRLICGLETFFFFLVKLQLDLVMYENHSGGAGVEDMRGHGEQLRLGTVRAMEGHWCRCNLSCS
jgi:hypothetical protein